MFDIVSGRRASFGRGAYEICTSEGGTAPGKPIQGVLYISLLPSCLRSSLARLPWGVEMSHVGRGPYLHLRVQEADQLPLLECG